MALSSEDLSDEVKRQKIEDMYNGYKKKFPDVPDLSAQKPMNLTAGRRTVLIDIREPREQQVSIQAGNIGIRNVLRPVRHIVFKLFTAAV